MALGTLGQLSSLLNAGGHKKTSLVPTRPKVTGEELEPGSHQECLTHITLRPLRQYLTSAFWEVVQRDMGRSRRRYGQESGRGERWRHTEKREPERGGQKINKERRQGGE